MMKELVKKISSKIIQNGLGDYNKSFEGQQLKRLALANRDFIFTITRRNVNERCLINFYLPDYPKDLIQSSILDNYSFFNEHELLSISSYLAKDSVILDIGANIGNHSLYWAMIGKAQRVIAFEPFPLTYKHLQKHIELNNLHNIVEAHNIGLGSTKSFAETALYDEKNVGGSQIKVSSTGNLKIEALDNLDLNLAKLDLMKIDVEGFEFHVLEGAKKTISRFKPIIVLEHFGKRDVLDEKMRQIGYVYVQDVNLGDTFLYKYKE